MQCLPAAVLNRCGEYIESARCIAVQVEENGAPSKVLLDPVDEIFPNSLKKRMAGCDPLQSWVLLENRFIKDDLPVLSRQSAKAELQSIACWQQVSRDAADSIN